LQNIIEGKKEPNYLTDENLSLWEI